MNLNELKENLKKQIRSEDVSQAVPRHNAFEVEVIGMERENYVFVNKGDRVEMWDTSVTRDEPRLMWYVDERLTEPMPFGYKSADEFYTHLYRKALQGVDEVWFLGYVNSKTKTFEPLEME